MVVLLNDPSQPDRIRLSKLNPPVEDYVVGDLASGLQILAIREDDIVKDLARVIEARLIGGSTGNSRAGRDPLPSRS